jgi:hypothetical protein
VATTPPAAATPPAPAAKPGAPDLSHLAQPIEAEFEPGTPEITKPEAAPPAPPPLTATQQAAAQKLQTGASLSPQELDDLQKSLESQRQALEKALQTPAESPEVPAPVPAPTPLTKPTAPEKLAEPAVPDGLHQKAAALVRAESMTSTSFIQRRMQLPYNQAAAVVARLEREGVISAPDPKSGRRTVLPFTPTTAPTAPAPKATPAPKPTATKPAAKPRLAPSEWREVGKNAEGQTLYEDQRGVRSRVEGGVRVTEAVRITPDGSLILPAKHRQSPEWNVAEEAAQKPPTKPAPRPAPAPAPVPAPKPAPAPQPATAKDQEYGAKNKLVTKDRAEELRVLLRNKLKNSQLSVFAQM